jgi:hypothetical protein
LEILALQLRNELGETLLISLDSDRLENGSDVLGGWGRVATEGEEKVCSEVLHFESCVGQFLRLQM